MESPSIRPISECYIKPKSIVEESKKPYYLGSFELFPMSLCYIQIGLAFDKLPSMEEGGMDSFLERLKQSLSSTLVHFYPLAGQLVTEVDDERHNCVIYIDCNKGHGVKFIHAALDNVSVNDIVSPANVPTIVQSFFELGRVPTNYDAHDEPLLSIQLTQFVDGLFLGVSVSHSVIDGTIFWNLLSSWTEIFQTNDPKISRPPICDRWFPEGHGPIIRLPYTHPDEFITRYKRENEDRIKEVVLHFSAESIRALKEKANEDSATNGNVSSIQALSSLIWRAIARSCCSVSDTYTTLVLIANGRSRLCPPLSPDYVGNFIHPIIKSVRVEELLGRSLGWVALLLHRGVQELTDQVLRDEFVKWIASPFIPRHGKMTPNSVVIAGHPRVDLSKIEFGPVGKPVAIRTGSDKYDGRVFLRPGKQGRGSISVEVCLSPDKMIVFQQDPELMSFLY